MVQPMISGKVVKKAYSDRDYPVRVLNKDLNKVLNN